MKIGILQRVVTGIKQRLRSPAPLLPVAWVEEGQAELSVGPNTAPQPDRTAASLPLQWSVC